jgi:flagellar protein FliO/FliZ
VSGNLFSLKKLFQIVLVLTIIQLGIGGYAAHAADLNGTVKDFYDHPKQQPADKKAGITDSKQTVAAPKSTGLTFWDFMRMIFATIFVIGLLYISLKFINKKSKAYQKANSIENIGGTSLGSNRSVQLIKVGNSILVVGVGETIQLLKEIDDQEEYQNLLQDYNDKMDHMIQPGGIISKLKQKLNASDTVSTGFASQLKKQLEEISKNRKKVIKQLDEEERDRK